MTVQDPADLLGIHFPNRVGLAAGFAKDAKTLWGLRMLGFGFIEMGTITARAQPGNPRPRIWRLPQDRALINAVGFHNNGADRAAYTVKCSGKPPIPIGISIGKSAAIPAENTEEVIRDLLRSIYTLGPYGDYFVLNVSSPNTPGLRGLQSAEQLSPIVRSCKTALGKKPLLIKIAPDLTNEALDDVLQTCTDQGVGLVATNTMPTPQGGMSGRPLQGSSLQTVQYARRHAPNLAIVGVGGIASIDDARRMIEIAGADLVELFTGIMYEGPFLPHRIARNLKGTQ